MSTFALLIETDRLILRRFVPGDAAFILELVNDPSFVRYIGDRGVRSLDDALAYLTNGPLASYVEHGFGLYFVGLRTDGTPIGMCGLLKRKHLSDPDIGFAFLPPFRGSGFALEAATAVMDYGREALSLGRIVAITARDNSSSMRLLEKIGFRFERLTRMADDADEVRLFVNDAPVAP